MKWKVFPLPPFTSLQKNNESCEWNQRQVTEMQWIISSTSYTPPQLAQKKDRKYFIRIFDYNQSFQFIWIKTPAHPMLYIANELVSAAANNFWGNLM